MGFSKAWDKKGLKPKKGRELLQPEKNAKVEIAKLAKPEKNAGEATNNIAGAGGESK
jgi:hypothetical protein